MHAIVIAAEATNHRNNIFYLTHAAYAPEMLLSVAKGRRTDSLAEIDELNHE